MVYGFEIAFSEGQCGHSFFELTLIFFFINLIITIGDSRFEPETSGSINRIKI